MKPWELLATAAIPGGGGELRLFCRDTEYSVRLSGFELMNSRMHGSEDELARLALSRVADRTAPRVLIGGLGMGFTVAAALRELPPTGVIEVVELVPEVIEWNRDRLADVAGRPLDDARVKVTEDDVVRVIRRTDGSRDAILLDVDNGPEGLTRKSNDRLYSLRGLAAARAALAPGGVLAVWSASGDQAFTDRLREAKFEVDTEQVRPHRRRRGARHTIWVATRT